MSQLEKAISLREYYNCWNIFNIHWARFTYINTEVQSEELVQKSTLTSASALTRASHHDTISSSLQPHSSSDQVSKRDWLKITRFKKNPDSVGIPFGYILLSGP